MKSKCVIYSRVSTTEQAEQGRSIGDQITICKRYASDNNYEPVGIFKDEGKTATNMNRAALQDMILKCQEDNIAAVLILDTDRLARNPSDHLQIKTMLKKEGTKVISVNQPNLSDDSAESNLMDLIIAGINGFQSEITGRKVLKTMKEKFREGWLPQEAPLGYVNYNKGTKDKPDRIIIPDTERAPLIVKAFELFSTGLYSLETLNSDLYKRGLRSRKSAAISISVLHRCIRNSFYYGWMKFDGEEKEGRHQPLISKELFDRCQRILDERSEGKNRERKFKFILRGFVTCGICGSKYTAEHHQNKQSYYHCPSKAHSNKKQNVEISNLEKQVEELFGLIQLPRSLIDNIVSQAKIILKESYSKTAEDRRILAIRLEKLEQRRYNAEVKFADGQIAVEVYKRLSDGVNEEITAIEQQLEDSKTGKSDNLAIFEQLIYLTQNIKKAYMDAPLELKQTYLKIFWDSIEVKDRRIKKAVPTKLFLELLPNYNFAQSCKKPSDHKIITTDVWR